MKTAVNIIILILPQILFGQKYNIDSLFKVYENDIKTEQKYHEGHTIHDKYTEMNFYLFMKICPIDSLLKYIDNPNPEIKCAIFSGLVGKAADTTITYAIFNKYKNDTTSFRTQYSDVVLTWTISEYMATTLKYSDGRKIDYEKRLNSLKSQPDFIIKGARFNFISKKDLLLLDSLYCDNKDFRLMSFIFTYKTRSKNNSKILSLESNGNLISDSIKKVMKKLKKGSRIWFEDIRVLGPNGENRNIGTRALIIH